MKIDVAIADVESAETELADLLSKVGERHRVDHDVYHMTRTLAQKSRESLAELRPAAGWHGTEVDPDHGRPGDGLLATLREKGAERIGRRPEDATLLLHDLREVHLLAARASINWVILAQGAQAVRDQELLAIVTSRHPFALKTLKWTTTRLKQTAPQVLAT